MDWCGKFVVLSFFHSSLICAGKTDLGLGTEEAPVKRERSEVQDEMVALFGSEKQKRAFAAYKRNKVGSEALQTALATAVTHAEASFEAVEEGKLFVHELQFAVENIAPTIVLCSTFGTRVRAGSTVQPTSRGSTGCIQNQ